MNKPSKVWPLCFCVASFAAIEKQKNKSWCGWNTGRYGAWSVRWSKPNPELIWIFPIIYMAALKMICLLNGNIAVLEESLLLSVQYVLVHVCNPGEMFYCGCSTVYFASITSHLGWVVQSRIRLIDNQQSSSLRFMSQQPLQIWTKTNQEISQTITMQAF